MSGVHIGEDVMRSVERGHSAARTEAGGWVLSWLPGRVLDRNQAITGMILAELVATELKPATGEWPDYEAWAAANPDLAPHVEGWAGELGISGGFATSMVRLADAAALDAAAADAADSAEDVDEDGQDDVDAADAGRDVDQDDSGDVMFDGDGLP